MKDLVKMTDSLKGGFPDWDRFDKFFDRFADNFTENFFTNFPTSVGQPKASFPKINAWEEDGAYHIEAALAGFDKDDVELEFKDNSLYIKVSKKQDKEEKGKKYAIREISHRTASRGIQFASPVDVNKISSTFENGVLKVDLGKENVPEKPDSVKIDIK